MEVELLTDLTRLPEIYRLRVLAHEHSAKAAFVNRERFPNGWKDELDELPETVHFVVETAEGQIIAAGRIAVVQDLAAVHQDLSGISLPSARPFAYWSRLCVHPEYRGHKITHLLYAFHRQVTQSAGVAFTLAFADPLAQKMLLEYGYAIVGSLWYDWGPEIPKASWQHQVMVFNC